MFSLTPNTTPQDALGAFAILQLLGDDNKYKQRLNELTQLVQQAQQQKDEAQAAQKAAAEQKAQAVATMADADQQYSRAQGLQRAADERHAQLTDHAKQLDAYAVQLQADSDQHFRDRETANQAKAQELAEREKAISVKEVSLVNRSLQLDADEKQQADLHAKLLNELADKEQANRQEAGNLAVLRQELQGKLDKLKASLATI